jgi:hypothetical protein
MSETQTRAWIAIAERIAAEHPDWSAFVVWARAQQMVYEAARRRWRDRNPLIDVAALEEAYGVSPVLLTVEQLKG